MHNRPNIEAFIKRSREIRKLIPDWMIEKLPAKKKD